MAWEIVKDSELIKMAINQSISNLRAGWSSELLELSISSFSLVGRAPLFSKP
jgi:hypothetical protein